MAEVVLTLLIISVMIVLGVIGETIFHKTNIPDVLWLVFFGMLAGPVLGLVSNNFLWDFAPYFSALALIVILFNGGFHLNVYEVIRETPVSFALALFGFLLTVIMVTAATMALSIFGFLSNWSITHGVLLGAIIGGSSSIIVMPLVSKANMSKKVKSILGIESAFTDALTIIVVIAVIKFIQLPEVTTSLIVKEIIGSFAIGIVLGFITGVLWMYALKFFAEKSKEVIHHYMLTFAFVLILYSFVEFIEASGAIAVLFFGLVLGNSKQIKNMLKLKDDVIVDKKIFDFNEEIGFFVKTFFFALIGMLFVFELKSITLGLILALIVLIVRPVAVRLATIKQKLVTEERQIMNFMMPRGLAAAVLALIPLQQGIQGTSDFPGYVFTLIIISIIVTTIGVYFAMKNMNLGKNNLEKNNNSKAKPGKNSVEETI